MPTLDTRLQRNLPKHAQLQHALRTRLRGAPAGKLLPSIADMRAEFGVAQATVDRALRELRHEGLIEVRQGSGIFATGRAELMSVGLYFSYDVLAEQFGLFPRLLLKGLLSAATRLPNMQLRQYLAMGEGEPWVNRVCTLADDVRRGLLDGVVAVGTYGQELSGVQIPAVAFRRLPHVPHQVDLDYEALITLGVQAAAARGARRLAFLGPRADCETGYTELPHASELFARLVAQHGMTTRADWLGCETHATTAEHAIELGQRAMQEWCSTGDDRPDGVFSIDDYLTVGALQAATACGLTAGRDIHFVSHANRGSSNLAGAAVTRLEIDPQELGAVLLQRVTELIAGQHGERSLSLVSPRVVA